MFNPLNFFKKIIGKISKKLQPKEYFVKVRGPEQIRKTNKALKKENAQLMAKLAKLKKKNKKLKELNKKIKEGIEKEHKESIKAQKKQIKKRKKENRNKILFESKPPQIRSVIKHKPFKGNGFSYKYWRGIEFEDKKDGPVVNLLLSQKPNSEKIGRLEGPPLQVFPYLFNIGTLVQDLKSGRIDINMTPDGRFIPPTTFTAKPEKDKEKKKARDGGEKKSDQKIKQPDLERMKQIDLQELIRTADPKVQSAIMDLYKRLQTALSEKREALESEKEALFEKMDAKITAKSYEKAYDRSTALLSTALSKIDTAYDRLAQSKIKELDASIKQTLSEMITRRLWQAIDTSLDKVKDVGKEDKEVIKESIQKDIQFATRQVMNQLAMAREMTPKVKKVKKAKSKKRKRKRKRK